MSGRLHFASVSRPFVDGFENAKPGTCVVSLGSARLKIKKAVVSKIKLSLPRFFVYAISFPAFLYFMPQSLGIPVVSLAVPNIDKLKEITSDDLSCMWTGM